MDTVTPYSTSVRMEQRLSDDPWDCLFGSDSITDAIQFRSEMFHMDICCCDNTGSSLDCLGLGFGFNSHLLSNIEDDPAGFSCEKSRSSASNLEDLNLDSDSELALTLDPNLILPHNGPIRSPTPGSEVPMLGASTKKRSVVRLEEEETENDSEPERTENDEESEDEDEEESENEENDHNETEYETAEDVTEEEEEEEDEEEEEEEAEDEEEEDDENASVRRPPPSSLETPTSIPASSTLAASSPTIQLTRVQMQQHHPKIGTMKVHDIKMLTATNSTTGGGGQTSHHIRKQVYNNNLHDIGSSAVTTVMIQAKREKDPTAGHIENPYPKPAYSYSCLIAMALKNSRSGSLPVSEIYNFMCRHFPYFKTAPNGWKNSVRHNLSLNKCFEKIEKPPGSGSQRKGCLWAIHPSKMAKMDEEVRKWSRKDPVAIKRAMVCPDQLELLERGEMKYEGDGHEELYEDAESYASSENETGVDEGDEAVNDEENVTHDETKHIDVVDDDIVVEELYDDIDIDDDDAGTADMLDTRLITNNFSKQEQSFVYELVSCQKRPKTVTGLRNDYVYQQIDAPTPRRKAHVVAVQSGITEPGHPA